MRAVVGSVNRDTVVWRVYDASRVNDGANALMQQRARRRSVVAVADYSPAAAAAACCCYGCLCRGRPSLLGRGRKSAHVLKHCENWRSFTPDREFEFY